MKFQTGVSKFNFQLRSFRSEFQIKARMNRFDYKEASCQHCTKLRVFDKPKAVIEYSAKRDLTQFCELFTMIPCAPKYLKN